METTLVSLWGSPGPTGKSSARERTTLLLDKDDRGRRGLGLPGGGGEARGGEGGGESAEELKWARDRPVNLKGEAGERGEDIEDEEEKDGGTAAGGEGVEETF